MANHLRDADGNLLRDSDGNFKGENCACTCQCYIPFRCDDITPATFGIPASLVRRLPMFFKLAGGDGTVYFIPQFAEPVDCPDDVEVAIVEVENCEGLPPRCCQVWDCCISSIGWFKWNKPTLAFDNGTEYWPATQAAYATLDDKILNDGCNGFFRRFSQAVDYDWGDGDTKLRCKVEVDDNELFVWVQKGDGTEAEWSDAFFILATRATLAVATCCQRKWLAAFWNDYTTAGSPEGTVDITLDMQQSNCCQSTLSLDTDLWNAGTTYLAGDLVIYGDGDDHRFVYVSVHGGNTGNQPDISPLWWQPAYAYPCGAFGGCPEYETCEDIEFGGVH